METMDEAVFILPPTLQQGGRMCERAALSLKPAVRTTGSGQASLFQGCNHDAMELIQSMAGVGPF